MSEKNYMADPPSDFVENLGIGASLQPDLVTAFIITRVQTVGTKLAEITQTLNSKVSSRHWVGKSGDQTRDELDALARTTKAASDVLADHTKQVQDVVSSQATAKSVCEQNSQCSPGMSPMAQAKAVARAMQNHYHEPGEPEYPILQYPGSPPNEQTEDRGETPDGQSQIQAQSPSGGASSSGAAAQGESAAVSAAAKQQQADTASATQQSPDAQADGQDAGQDKGAGSGQGTGGSGSGGGDGAGSGSGGKPGAGEDGAPSGGSPAAGSPFTGAGSGFEPSESGATHAMSAGDGTLSSSSGGSPLGGGGVGTLGGDHERALSAKTSPGGVMAGRPVVNVNAPASMGGAQNAGMGGFGGGMGGSHGGKGEDKTHKTADYLKGEHNGYELFGGNLPVATPEVIGELTKDEYQKMAEAAAKQKAASNGA